MWSRSWLGMQAQVHISVVVALLHSVAREDPRSHSCCCQVVAEGKSLVFDGHSSSILKPGDSYLPLLFSRLLDVSKQVESSF